MAFLQQTLYTVENTNRNLEHYQQIAGGQRITLGIISLFIHENLGSDPSQEPSRQDGSNEVSQRMFS